MSSPASKYFFNSLPFAVASSLILLSSILGYNQIEIDRVSWIFESGNARDVDGKKCSQQKNSTNKLSNHQKLTIARLWRVVSKTHDEEAVVKSIQRRLAGWNDFRSNITLFFLAIVSGFAGLYVFFPV